MPVLDTGDIAVNRNKILTLTNLPINIYNVSAYKHLIHFKYLKYLILFNGIIAFLYIFNIFK